MMRIFSLLVLISIRFCANGQYRIEPTEGLAVFQDSLAKNCVELGNRLRTYGVVMASYDVQVVKGKVKSILYSNGFEVNDELNTLLMQALKSRNWKPYKKKSLATQVILWFKDTIAVDSFVIPGIQDRMAEPLMGQSKFSQFITKQIQIPDSFFNKKRAINNYNLFMRFRISPNGDISNIYESPDKDKCSSAVLVQEAAKAIKKSEPWVPAVENGKRVSAWREIPIRIMFNY